MESYKCFSEIYDSLMSDVDYDSWTNFIVEKLDFDTRNILEAACGTGNITKYLAQKNYNIVAFDKSEEMLIKAYEKLRGYNNVKILNLDMTNFKIDKKFDAIICCCDGINYLENENQILDFLNLAKIHINKGGKLIFDISTEYKYKHILGNETFVYDDGEIFYVWENSLNEDEMKINIEINFFKNVNDDLYKRIVEMQTQKIYTIDEIKKFLEIYDFKVLSIFDGYKNKEYMDESQRAVFYCEKI